MRAYVCIHLHRLRVGLREVTRRKVVMAQHVHDQISTLWVILVVILVEDKSMNSPNLLLVHLLCLDKGVSVDVIIANGAVQPADPIWIVELALGTGHWKTKGVQHQ